MQVQESLLEGHLGITKELLAFQPSDKKYNMGSENGGANLIKVWWRRLCNMGSETGGANTKDYMLECDNGELFAVIFLTLQHSVS